VPRVSAPRNTSPRWCAASPAASSRCGGRAQPALVREGMGGEARCAPGAMGVRAFLTGERIRETSHARPLKVQLTHIGVTWRAYIGRMPWTWRETPGEWSTMVGGPTASAPT